MRLTQSISLVGSGDLGGFSLTHPLDCHVYLLDCYTELALIDAGSGLEIENLYHNITANNYRLEDVKTLLLTHSHFDHAGGAARIRQDLNVKVIASSRTAEILSAGDAESSGLAPLQQAGIYPPDVMLEPCTVDVIIEDNREFQIGSKTIRPIATQGHSADHFSYFVQGETLDLFAGDSVLAGGKILLQNLPDVKLDDYRDTILRLNQFDVDRLFPGHGLMALARANRHMRAAKQQLELFRFPENGILD